MADKYLNCLKQKCPMPIVNIGKALKELKIGETLEAEADDPAFKADVEAFVSMLEHTLVSVQEGESTTKVIIRKEK